MLGSSAREDKCRNCAGDGSSCKTVDGTLNNDDLTVGEFSVETKFSVANKVLVASKYNFTYSGLLSKKNSH